MAMTKDGTATPDLEDLTAALRAPLLKVFPAALLGRLVTIPYYPLSDQMIEVIADHKLRAIAGRLAKQYEAELVIGKGVHELIKARCTEIESGGRMIDAILTNTLLPELSRQLLHKALDGGVISRVEVTGDNAGFSYHFE
jgi:type VI secretion system protein VasG